MGRGRPALGRAHRAGGVAAGLVAQLGIARRWRLVADQLDVSRQPWPVEPPLSFDPDPRSGPILVTVDYEVPADRHRDFRQLMHAVGRARRRTGAERWGLFQ